MVTGTFLSVRQDLDGFQAAPVPASLAESGADPLATVLAGRKLLHYCRSQDAASINATGLWPGSWCTVTGIASLVVDVWLGLPSRRNYVFVLDPSGVLAYRGPGMAPAFPGDPFRHGGAVEFFLPDGAPPAAIVAHGRLEEF